MKCNCRRDPTKYCPAWRTIRRQTIRSMHLDGLRLRDIADKWGMRHVGAVINQLGDSYIYRHPAEYVKSIIAENDTERKVYTPISNCVSDGFTLSAVYRALKSGDKYAGLFWRYGS